VLQFEHRFTWTEQVPACATVLRGHSYGRQV
jgi:hypothetical protein